jgi:hypothetical protein
MVEKKWTLCTKPFGRIIKHAQYSTKEKAEELVRANGEGWFIKLCPVNKRRIVKAGGRRSCEVLIRVGLPQY